jgi:hypothetical protein
MNFVKFGWSMTDFRKGQEDKTMAEVDFGLTQLVSPTLS